MKKTLPSQSGSEHVCYENRSCHAVVNEVDVPYYGEHFGDADKEVKVGNKN